jgi:fibronectin type 3 domain-containing protein
MLGVALAGFLFCGSARAAITLQDGGTNVIKTSANSITAPGFTVTAGASVLVVNVFTRDNQTADALPATLPWGAQTLTKIASVNNGNSTWAWSEIYYLYNPAAMTQDITISEAPSSQAMTMQVFTLAGVDTAFAPVPYTAQNASAQSVTVTLAGTPSGSWAAVSSSYGTGNLLMNVTASSGTVNCATVQNSTSQCMGYVANITSSSSTITATDNAGNQKLSLAVAVFMPAGAVPGAPTLSAAGSGSQVTLTWSAVANASSYNVLRSTTSGGETLLVGGRTGTTYTDTTTAIGTRYYYEVQAVNGNGTSGNSAEVSVTPLSAPTGLAATAQTNRVLLTWTDTSGGAATGFAVQRSITSGGPYSTIATGVASTSYIDHTVYDGTAYYYVVEALNSSATSSASAQAGPATPFFALPAGAATGVLLKDGGTNSITTTGSGVSTISANFTVSSGAHVLVVELWDNDTANNGSSPSVITWVVGTTTNILTRAVSQSSTAADCNIYYVFNPTSGAGTISVTDDNGASVQGMSMMPFTLRGVDTTVAPVIYKNTSASATTVSVSLASVTPATAWASVLSSDSSIGQALTQTSTSGTSIYKSVNNNACLGYVQNLAGGSATIAMHGASGAVSLAVAVFMPAVATPIGILDGSITTVADGGGSGIVTMPFSVSEGATVLAAALGQINNANPFTTNILWANTTLGVTQNVFAVASQWAGYGQIHPNVHALIDPLPGNGFLIATLPGNGASHLFLQAYTLVGVDTAIPTAVYGAGTESTLPAGVRTNYVAVNLAPGTPANSWAEVCTYDNAGNLSALMTIGCTNNGAAVGTVVTTNFNPSVLCTAGYVSNLPNSACTISALHGVSGAADALGINVAVFSPLVLQTVPAAPINVVATPHTGQVTLSWANNSIANSYNVYRSTTSGSGYQLIATTIGNTATNFTDTYVVGGTTYYYVIQGVNIAGQSPNSAEVSATPSSGPIIGTGIGVVDGSVNNTITVGAVTNFSMPFSVSYGASVLVAATYDNNGNNSSEKGPALVWSNATSGITQPLTAAVVGSPGADNQTWGTLYYLMAPLPGVGAVVATETVAGQNTTFLQAYTLGGVDTNVAPTTAQNGSVGASTLSVDTDPSTLSFSWAAVIAVNYNGGAGNDIAITSTSGSVTTVNTRPNNLQCRAGYISNLGAGDTTITATATGVSTSMYLATEVFSPLITMPAPSSVTATGQTNQIRVTWATVSGATSYVLLRSIISGHGYTPISTNSTTSYTDTTVTDWVPYYYVVQAYGPNGVSIYSPEATAYAVGTPSAARGLTAFGDIHRVDLSWNSELGADSYTVLRSTTSGGEATLVSGLTVTNYTDSSVVDGTRYYYQVRVVNNTYGTGPTSAEASAIPVVTFFTNWFGIFTSPGGNIGTWTAINGSPNINLAENTVLGAPDFPSFGPSTDCLIIETNMGPNATADLQGMGNAFSPSINVHTYRSLELDIKNFGTYDRNNQIQAIQLNLQVPVGGVPTYERGTWGDIVLSAAGTGGDWTHYTVPLTNWAAYDLTQVTSVGINVFDSLYLASSDMAVGVANIEFSGAPGWKSVISAVNRAAATGSTSVTLTGKVTGLVDSTNLPLFLNTPITVTINGSTQNTFINDATGDFSIAFNTTGFANGVYPVTYTSASDMVGLIGATNTSTTLTLSAPPPRPTILPTYVDATHTNLVLRVGTQSGWNYYLLTTTNLTPPVVWSTNSVTLGTGGTITNLVPIRATPAELFLRYLIR